MKKYQIVLETELPDETDPVLATAELTAILNGFAVVLGVTDVTPRPPEPKPPLWCGHPAEDAVTDTSGAACCPACGDDLSEEASLPPGIAKDPYAL
jgi:hypothetical protein